MRRAEPIKIADGTLYADEAGTLFVGYHGGRVLFRGVRTKVGGALPNAAFQLNGCIRIGRGWHPSFRLRDFAHEYGHYLQQCRLGAWGYAWLATKSVFSLIGATLLRRHNHFSRSFERHATALGDAYLKAHYHPAQPK